MPKDLTPTNRGLEPELEGAKVEPPKPAEPLVYEKVVESGKGYLIVETNKGKIKFYDGTLSWRNNNPGNLKYGEFARSMGAIGEGHEDMAVFKTFEDGKKAQYELVFGKNSKYTSLNIMDAMKRYAPSSDNNDPKEYANFIVAKAKINKTSTLGKLTTTQKIAVINAITQMEGFKVGNKKVL